MSINFNIIIFLILIVLMPFYCNGQEKEKFKGESFLKDCVADLPLTFKKEDKAAYEVAATKYKDVKLILLSYNKKNKIWEYARYYVVLQKVNDRTFVYLVDADKYNSNDNSKVAIFTAFNKEKDLFLLSDCFDEFLMKHTEYSSQFKEK